MISHFRLRRRVSRARAARSLRARSGIALFISMFFVAGIGALALSAIYLTASATLLSKSYEKEDELKYASEAALAIGKGTLNFNPAALPLTNFDTMMTNMPVRAADGTLVPNMKVNLWVGPTGSTSGQYGRFASLVAEARDAGGAGFVRRLELTQESFAKYAYWTNSETNNGSTIYFANGDQIWGPVWSNDDINIASSGATFRDAVGTAGTINGAGYGTFVKGYSTNQKPINLPALTTLSTLAGLAGTGGMSFTAPTTGNESTVRMRIEFVALDLNADADSTDDPEGFFRVYTVTNGNQAWLRGDWPGADNALPLQSDVTNCGDWHQITLASASGAGGSGITTGLKFFPAAVHNQTWFRDLLDNNGGLTSSEATTEMNRTLTQIMTSPGARCYLGGDPHLVAVARNGAAGAVANAYKKGGDDTTMTGIDAKGGTWTVANPTPIGPLAAARPAGDGKYLYPLYRGYNNNTKGVMYVAGTVGVSGTLRAAITLYSPNTIVILDDLRYANDPAKGVCIDIFGMISGANTIVADNALNTPQTVKTSGGVLMKSIDDTPDLYIHSVIMALGTAFQVEHYDQGETNVTGCQGINNQRGCLYLTGGIIQNNRGAVGQVNGRGFTKRYSYDRCAVVNPPPYFPTTGRFQDNRYYELDPVRFNVAQLFQSLQKNQ
ncbi:MAG TPA: hypothetical protein VIP11_18995 [Gemmatimonadaceae bacterium]